MIRPIQVVIDTDVFISALRSSQGASHRLLSLIGSSPKFEINLSVPLVLEYEEVAKRYIAEIGLNDQDIDDILDYMCLVGNHCKIYFLWRPILHDPGDDMVLELAVEASCDYIVSFNERHFSPACKQFGINVIRPGELLRELGLQS
jgi:putative PIN family toxin of toxin-antitoxin system